MLPRELERQSVLIEKIGSLPTGVPLELTTTARHRIQGRLGFATDDTVHINTSNGETVWMFDELRSVRRLDRRRFGFVHRLLALLLATACGLSAANLRSKALDIPNGAKVEVQTKSGEKHAGLLRAVAEEGITVELVSSRPGAQRVFAFDEMKSLKYPRNGLHPGIVAALTIGALMAISGLVGGG